MKEDDLKYMVLRYFFNKMMENKNTNSDPVFVEGNNNYAKTQLNNDIRWFITN